MSDVEVSVVVPVRDGADGLRALLPSLERQSLARDRFEVIVVDNASRDESARVASAAGARVVAEPIPSRSRARNRGVAAARAELIAFTDADCVARPEWLEALIEGDRDEPLIAGAVAVTTSRWPNAVERFEGLWRFEQEAWVRHGWAATANLLVERGAFDAIGGFDVAYRSIGEDADFCLRAQRAGLGLGYRPRAVIEHHGEDEWWPMLKRSFWHGYSSAQVSRRLGAGYVAWRRLRPLLKGDAAAEAIGITRERVAPDDWRTMCRVARAAYAMRVAGSLWSGLRRAK